MDKISIFYPLHVSVMNISNNIRLFQKSYGVGLAYGGNKWQHVGSFWTVGDIEGVFFILLVPTIKISIIAATSAS